MPLDEIFTNAVQGIICNQHRTIIGFWFWYSREHKVFHSRYGAIDPLGSFYQNKLHFKSSWACGWDVEMCSVAELEGRVYLHNSNDGHRHSHNGPNGPFLYFTYFSCFSWSQAAELRQNVSNWPKSWTTLLLRTKAANHESKRSWLIPKQRQY